jgi:predicted Zn-dependent protease with MMP-like domain
VNDKVSSDWRDRRAPSLEDFDALARAAFDALPPRFRAMCGNVVFHVADFADEDALGDLGIDDPFELTGLYEGVDIGSETIDAPSGPHHIHLFRQPLLAEWIDHGETTLGALIRHVVVHELGHHFGLSDEAMHEIEDKAGA